MSDNVQISCKINTSDALAQLGLEIRLDNTVIFSSAHVQEEINFNHLLNDDDGDHKLEFVMKNKGVTDTTIDADGNIVKDARLIVSNLAFDDIKLNQIFIEKAVYTHNFNGTGEEIKDKFYGELGCNGIVSLEFTTPVYLWLLENM
jgi:hypothetical protein